MHSFDAIPDGAAVGSKPSVGPRETRSTAAGFGSPGADSTVKRIDLNDALIRHPDATFVMRAAGAAMQGAGIDDADVLLVDRAIQPSHGHIVVAVVEGELVCRRLCKQAGATRLEAALTDQGAQNADIVPRDGMPLEVWGVVTTVIKSLMPW
jgi:DNA polymerase V